MKNLLELATLGLATTRLTQIVTEDAITEPFRLALEKKQQGAQPGSFTDWVDTGVNCPACVSVWAGGAVLVSDRWPGLLGRSLVQALALSQLTMIVRSLIERIER